MKVPATMFLSRYYQTYWHKQNHWSGKTLDYPGRQDLFDLFFSSDDFFYVYYVWNARGSIIDGHKSWNKIFTLFEAQEVRRK